MLRTAVAPAPAGGQPACTVVGYTAAPGQESPHCMDKQISHCGSTTLHETGTTFFTDGTSGWTQTCASQMSAQGIPSPTPQPDSPTSEPSLDRDTYDEQTADDHRDTHPGPSYDPNSADGYGPEQGLPPACLRLDGEDC